MYYGLFVDFSFETLFSQFVENTIVLSILVVSVLVVFFAYEKKTTAMPDSVLAWFFISIIILGVLTGLITGFILVVSFMALPLHMIIYAIEISVIGCIFYIVYKTVHENVLPHTIDYKIDKIKNTSDNKLIIKYSKSLLNNSLKRDQYLLIITRLMKYSKAQNVELLYDAYCKIKDSSIPKIRKNLLDYIFTFTLSNAHTTRLFKKIIKSKHTSVDYILSIIDDVHFLYLIELLKKNRNNNLEDKIINRLKEITNIHKRLLSFDKAILCGISKSNKEIIKLECINNIKSENAQKILSTMGSKRVVDKLINVKSKYVVPILVDKIKKTSWKTGYSKIKNICNKISNSENQNSNSSLLTIVRDKEIILLARSVALVTLANRDSDKRSLNKYYTGFAKELKNRILEALQTQQRSAESDLQHSYSSLSDFSDPDYYYDSGFETRGEFNAIKSLHHESIGDDMDTIENTKDAIKKIESMDSHSLLSEDVLKKYSYDIENRPYSLYSNGEPYHRDGYIKHNYYTD
ncbi:MAG: hypothetical protein H8E98_01370 [Bacteroidetes bacterium]|nr:hypothetical protein [Bacteroidota bacterium]